jgi:flagella basal body P-ring formation protein FlgA
MFISALAIGPIGLAHGAEVTAIVATRTIYPGQMVGTDQVARIALDRCDGCVPGYVVDQDAIVGKVAGRTILPNQLIYPDAVRLPSMVRQSADVTLVYQSGRMTVSVAATSLEEGAVGDVVTVRTRLNSALITGVVQADGTVLAAGR